ncbi:MAG: hypothetical protein IT559_09365 [Alphaproteobacteria bacterium]|nr:hypothetical protein [Alphaproteobacteria bacterium]
MVTSIFLIFPSGLPQPADFVIALAIGINFLAFIARAQSRFDPVFLYALGFGAFTFLINMIHYIALPDFTFLKSSFYYLYNASFFILVISLMRRSPQKTWRALYYGLVIAIIVEFLVIQFLPSLRGFRETGTFINPNQLAFWSLMAAGLLIVLKAKARLNLLDIGLLLILGYLQLLSLSKAGLICYILLMATLVIVPALTLKTRAVVLFAGFLFLIYGLSEVSRFEHLLENMGPLANAVSRLENIGGERDDSVAGRGYLRIVQYPEFLIFGAGEGGYSRFADFSTALEMHSGVGTLVFAYGFLGSLLFLGLLFYIGRHNDLLVISLIGILFLYGLTHQNIRTADFWLLLAVCYVYKEINFADLARRRRASRLDYTSPVTDFSKT